MLEVGWGWEDREGGGIEEKKTKEKKLMEMVNSFGTAKGRGWG